MLDIEISAFIHRLRDIADAGADGRPRRTISVERDRAELAILARAYLQPLECSRPVARIELLLSAIKHKPDRRTGGTRKRDSRSCVIARARFRSEPAAHSIDDDANPIARQHSGSELGREIDRKPVRPPIGDDGMSFHAAMGLHFRAEFRFDDGVGRREALRHVATRARFGGAAHVSVLLKFRTGRHTTPETETHYRRPKYLGCGGFPRIFDIDDERQHFVFDLDQA